MAHRHGVVAQVGEDAPRGGVAVEVAAHHVVQDVASDALNAGEDQDGAALQHGPAPRPNAQRLDPWRLVRARRRGGALHARVQPAALVLPPAAGAHHLLEQGRAAREGGKVGRGAAPEGVERGEQGAGEDRAGAKARALGDGGFDGEVDAAGVMAAAERAEPVAEVVARRGGDEAREDEGGLGERGPIGGTVGGKGEFVGAGGLEGAGEVETADADDWVIEASDGGADGGDAAEEHGHVDDRAALFLADGGRV